MTPEKINIAIAEVCGWRCCKRDIHIAEMVHTRPHHSLVGVEPYSKSDGSQPWHYWVMPNYHGDLNAMHEAERTLDGTTEWNGEENHTCAEEAYMGHLSKAVKDGRFADDWQLITATAAQRAEAFLRVLNLWRE